MTTDGPAKKFARVWNLLTRRTSLTALDRFLRNTARRFFPGISPRPETEKWLGDTGATDAKTNAETTPPEDETVELRSLWFVEFYPPSFVDQLATRMKALGWDFDAYGIDNTTPISWLRRLRALDNVSSWFDLGIVEPTDAEKSFPRHRTALLPPNVQRVRAKLFSPVSALTCLLVRFDFDEHETLIFDRALRRRRQSVARWRQGRWELPNPENLKHEEIRECGQRVRASLGNWIRSNVPGVFSAGLLGKQIPTCEFLTLAVGEPFPTIGGPVHGRYIDLLSVGSDFRAWRHRDKGLKFAWPEFGASDDKEFHAILACTQTSLAAHDLTTYGGGRFGEVAYVQEQVEGLLCHWAMVPLLAGFERHLNSVRDSTTLDASEGRKALGVVSSVSGLLRTSSDLVSVVSALKRYSERSNFEREISVFTPSYIKRYRNPEEPIGEALGKQIGDWAERLQQKEQTVRELLVEFASVLSSKENLRLQHQVTFLTWILLILTVLTFLTTAYQIFDVEISGPVPPIPCHYPCS